MNILYDHTIFQNQQYGGISRYFYELISRMSPKANTNVTLFQGLHINNYPLSNISCNKYLGYKPNLKIPSLYKSFLFTMPNKIAFHTLYSTSKHFDIYHPTYYYHGLNKHHKTPIVITIHDMIHEIYPDQLRFSNHFTRVKKEAIHIADAIICPSQNTKKDLLNIYDIPDNKITVIYHGNSLHTQVSLPPPIKPYLLYVGDRKSTYKNFRVLFNAYHNTLSEHFDLICFGGGKFNKYELNAIKNCTGNITQISGSDKLLTSLYKNAFCYICPSLYEGFGIPLLEALSTGCPVIASHTSSIPEVTNNAAILFNPISSSELTNAIESLHNEHKRNNLIRLGLEQSKKFSWDKTANETMKLYKTLI